MAPVVGAVHSSDCDHAQDGRHECGPYNTVFRHVNARHVVAIHHVGGIDDVDDGRHEGGPYDVPVGCLQL